ncbi:MAG: hypothetical protein ACRDTZ_07625 [Pseudonocardiaceae bacterium]
MGSAFGMIVGLISTIFTIFVIALLIGVFGDETTWNLLVAFVESGYNLAAHLVSNGVAALKNAW